MFRRTFNKLRWPDIETGRYHPEPKGDQALPDEATIVNDQLNTEEREILDKFERGELRPAPEADREMEIAPQAARNTFNKEKPRR